jgi:anti-anti-sigma regulatory factor
MPPVAGDRSPIMARISIEITMAEHSPVRLHLIAAIRADAPHITGLIIDMTRINAVSSVQLRALGTMREHAAELGIALCVATPTESVRRLLQLADITERTRVPQHRRRTRREAVCRHGHNPSPHEVAATRGAGPGRRLIALTLQRTAWTRQTRRRLRTSTPWIRPAQAGLPLMAARTAVRRRRVPASVRRGRKVPSSRGAALSPTWARVHTDSDSSSLKQPD